MIDVSNHMIENKQYDEQWKTFECEKITVTEPLVQTYFIAKIFTAMGLNLLLPEQSKLPRPSPRSDIRITSGYTPLNIDKA